MKNINTYIMISIVSLVLVVATAFLMTAADVEVREISGYLSLLMGAVFTWGDYLGQTYTITRSGTNNMATYNAKAEKAATATINKFLKQLEKNEAKNAG